MSLTLEQLVTRKGYIGAIGSGGGVRAVAVENAL